MLDKNSVAKIIAATAFFILALSVGYYFIYALPQHNKELERINDDKVSLEKQKYDDERTQEKEAALKKNLEEAETKQKVENNRKNLFICLNKAAEDRNNFMLNNGGTKNQDGLIEVESSIAEKAQKTEEVRKDECHRIYD